MDIIIPVYNRPKHTHQTITSLFENSSQQHRVVVVNDHSDKPTNMTLGRLKKKYDFTLINNESNIGPGASRNKACEYLSKTRDYYLYFSDNDVYFKKDWDSTLIWLYQSVSNKRISLLGASCHAYQQPNETFVVGDYRVAIRNAISGYSQLVTWEIFDRFGPFDTQEGLEIKTGRSDDWAFCQRIIKAGLLVASVIPELVVPTGSTDSYGRPAVGQETFNQVEGVFIQ